MAEWICLRLPTHSEVVEITPELIENPKENILEECKASLLIRW